MAIGRRYTNGLCEFKPSVALPLIQNLLRPADIGLRNLDLLLGLENRVLYTAIDILEGECRLDQAMIRDKRWKNLSMLAISRNRQRFNVTRAHMEQLVESIIGLGYQYVLIDCPAGEGRRACGVIASQLAVILSARA